MKIAFAILENCISPRLDTADTLWIYEIGTNGSKKILKLKLSSYPLYHIIFLIEQKAIDAVVCGSCPRSYIRILNSIGTKIFFHSEKDPELILNKYMENGILTK